MFFPVFPGPYPSAQIVPQERKSNLKTGPITWGAKTWAGVLNFAKFVHVNVAGKNPEDMNAIKKIVEDLKLHNNDKIVFNFNKTIDRGSHRGKSAAEQEGEKQNV